MQIISKTIEYSAELADHELLLAFNSDDHADKFQEWWGVKGKDMFTAYLEYCEKK